MPWLCRAYVIHFLVCVDSWEQYGSADNEQAVKFQQPSYPLLCLATVVHSLVLAELRSSIDTPIVRKRLNFSSNQFNFPI